MTSNQLTEPSNPAESPHAAHGRLGRGAKSAHGRAMSARNATRHGLTSKTFSLLHNEDPNIFEEHKREFLRDFGPRNANELHLVTQMIEASWLVMRSHAIETTALCVEVERQRKELDRSVNINEADLTWCAYEALQLRNGAFSNIARYRASQERAYENCLRNFRAGRQGKQPSPPHDIEYKRFLPENFFRNPHNETTPSNSVAANPESETLPDPATPALPYDQSSFTASNQSRAGEPDATPSTGAEGATAPETLRPKDRPDCTHLESDAQLQRQAPAEEITFSGTKDREGT